MQHLPPRSPLFPYTTLFRSVYRMRKFARRNKGGLAVAAMVLFFLILLGSGASPPLFRSEEHTSELQSRRDLVCRLLLEKKKARYLLASSSLNLFAEASQ